jgi:hypothetical protein
MLLTCECCGRSFEYRKPRRSCSKSCAAKLTYVAENKTWPPESEEWLEERVGIIPLTEIEEAYRQIAAQKGWPPRTYNALKSKAQRLGLRQRCHLDNLTRAELGRVLGISHTRVKTWTKQGLPYKQLSHTHTAVRVRDIRTFLLKNPDSAIGVNPEGLAWLLGDDAARKVLGRITRKNVPGIPRPVVNLSTGKVYPHVKAAGSECFVAGISIAGAIRRNGTCAGYRWAYLDEMGVRA